MKGGDTRALAMSVRGEPEEAKTDAGAGSDLESPEKHPDDDESGMLRLIDVKVDSLDEFKSIVDPLLPVDGIFKCIEVYICKLTAS